MEYQLSGAVTAHLPFVTLSHSRKNIRIGMNLKFAIIAPMRLRHINRRMPCQKAINITTSQTTPSRSRPIPSIQITHQKCPPTSPSSPAQTGALGTPSLKPSSHKITPSSSPPALSKKPNKQRNPSNRRPPPSPLSNSTSHPPPRSSPSSPPTSRKSSPKTPTNSSPSSTTRVSWKSSGTLRVRPTLLLLRT